MTPHTILKDFHGSQTGHDHDHFSRRAPLQDLSHGPRRSRRETRPRLTTSCRHPSKYQARTAVEPAEERSQGDAPANKMKKGAPENKGRN